MIEHNENSQLVDIKFVVIFFSFTLNSWNHRSDIDVAFFVVTVDLWSSDGKEEMNLVLHPSSADRYIPTNVAKPRRRPTMPSTPSQGPSSQASQVCLLSLNCGPI